MTQPSAIEFTTGDVRLSFPALAEMKPNAQGSDKLSYQAVLLLPPDTDLTPYKDAIRAALVAKFAKQPTGLKPLPLHDAETKPYAGYDKGWHYVPTRTERPPVLVNQLRQNVKPETFYAGCWVRARIRAWVYNNAFARGVSWELCALQFVRDGERLDGRNNKPTDPNAAFEALELPAEKSGGDLTWDPLA
jgi:hypothetical protein